MTTVRHNVKHIVDNVVLTKTGNAVAWFEIPITGWDFRLDEDRESLMMKMAATLGGFTSREVHWRVSSSPREIQDWAKVHHHDAPAPLGKVWEDYLVRVQTSQSGKLPQKRVFIGVSLQKKGTGAHLAGLVNALPWFAQDRKIHAALQPFLQDLGSVTEAIVEHATPCTPQAVSWLVRRSAAPGLGSPSESLWDQSEYTAEEIDAVFQAVQRDAAPFGKTTNIQRIHDETGDVESAHVVVLSMSRLREMDIPQTHAPWLQILDSLPFPCEVSMRAAIHPLETTSRKLRLNLQKIASQEAHYREHDMDPPAALAAQREKTLIAESELDNPHLGIAVRTSVWPRILVSGPTPEVARERAKIVATHLGRIATVAEVIDQQANLNAFIPGNNAPTPSMTCHLPAVTLAASLPSAGSSWGDIHGIPVGRTAGTSSAPAFFAPWAATEKSNSGLVAIAGAQGSGKTMLASILAVVGTMSGALGDVLDPSGQLQSMAKVEGLKDHVTVIDLLDGQDGALSPFAVVLDPLPEHFDDPKEFEDRKNLARSQRRSLVSSMILRILPPRLMDNELTEIVLMQALDRVPMVPSSSLEMVLDVLSNRNRGDDDIDEEMFVHRQKIGLALKSIKDTDVSRLIMPAAPERQQQTQAVTIWSLRGLKFPQDNAPVDPDERIGLAVLTSAAHMVLNRLYFRPRDQRKFILLDECRVLTMTSAGTQLISAASADSRKHNAAVFLLEQRPTNLVKLGVTQLLSAAFIGRVTGDEEQLAACELLDLPPSYHATFGSFPIDGDEPRTFLARDHRDRVERIQADLPWAQDLIKVMTTTANSRRERLKMTNRPPHGEPVSLVAPMQKGVPA